MHEATLRTLDVPMDRSSAYEAGVADGEECRRRKGKPSLLLLVALNDHYSDGFRAGFFRRALSKPRVTTAALGFLET